MIPIEVSAINYGRAPKKYGKAYKFSYKGMIALLRNNWKLVGKGRTYFYVSPPEDYQRDSKHPIITTCVPTKESIEQYIKSYLNVDLNTESREFYDPWALSYEPGGREEAPISFTVVTTIGNVQNEPEEPYKPTFTRRYFRLGCDGYSITIHWDEGTPVFQEQMFTDWSWKEVYFIQ
jgi:hypothetical protein